VLVCRKCGYAFCGHWQARRAPEREYRYYRCCGTEGGRFHGQRRCDARVAPVEVLDGAVWAEICRVLENPARVLREYQRRLETARTGSRRPELETIDRQLAKLRRGIGRLIDSYAEGIIDKAELEPRLAALRQRVGKLEAEAAALRDAAARTRSLRLVVGKLESFAGMVRDRLATADWATRRDLVRTLVRRIEIDDDQVRVIFRVDAGPDDRGGPGRSLQHCPGRARLMAPRGDRRGTGRGRSASGVVTGPVLGKAEQAVRGPPRS
jgi:site-specific DNA recombinase